MNAPFLLALAFALALVGSVVLERWSGVPSAVYLVPAGAVLSYLPGLPALTLKPSVVFYVFLPPLLYSASFFTSLREWRLHWRPIAGLALGLVVVTLFAVAETLGPALALTTAGAFVLGAVVGPTDPIAATAVMSRVGVPSRLRTILEGESLVNDGVALVIYSVAVSAGMSGSYSIVHGFVRFLESSLGGIALGVLLGFLVSHARLRLEDARLEILVSLVTPYLAYVPAERAHVSGVLATVAAGSYLGTQSEVLRPQTRLQAVAFWDVLTFLLESTLFLLLGAQYPVVVRGLSHYSPASLAWYALLLFGVVVTVRLAWQFVFPEALKAIRLLEERRPWRERLLLGWGGMRGALTLAAALALPQRFPNRDLVLYLAFSLIILTLLVQGVTLGPLIERLGLGRGEEAGRAELEARVKLAEAALAKLDELESELPAELLDSVRALYSARYEQNAEQLDQLGSDEDGHVSSEERSRVRAAVLASQRDALRRLSGERAIGQQTARRLQRELDLEESRLASAGDT